MGKRRILFFIVSTSVFSIILALSIYLISNYFISKSISHLYNKSTEEIQRIYRGALLNLLNTHKTNDEIIDFFMGESRVAYAAILNGEGEITNAGTKFEAFLPIDKSVTLSGGGVRELSTPAGKLSEISMPFMNSEKKFIVIGFFQPFTNIAKKQQRIHLFLLVSIVILISIIYSFLTISLEKRYYTKEIQLEREKKEKEQFLILSGISSGVSHEIKNPLNTLSLVIEKLSLGVEKEELEEITSIARREIDRIKFITENFSLLLKTSKGNKEWVKIDTIVKESSRLLSFFPDMEIEIKNRNVQLFSNPYMLRVVIKNILKNAADAMGGRGKLIIETEKSGDTLHLLFKDHGPGIKNPHKIFYPFYSEKHSGMGIGLFITKKIIEGLGWKIEAINWEKGGAIKISVPKGGYLET